MATLTKTLTKVLSMVGWSRLPLAAVVIVSLAACGGSDGTPATATASTSTSTSITSASTTPVTSPPPPSSVPEAVTAVAPSASLSGSVVKGPVTGAQVCAYELLATGKGKSLGCAISREDGSYSLPLDYVGAVLIEAQGGTYTDETTGRANTLLSTPLVSAANVGMGANTLHVTPLTAIAYSQATRAVSISIAAFNTAATQVRDAFGLPANVDLKATLPVVDLAGANPYGTALRGVSRMISMGASLSGMLANSNLDGLKSGYALSAQCLPGNPEVGAPQQPLQGTITLDDAVRPDGGVAFLVTNPVAAWRSLLPASGSVMGCDVAVNTSASVTLTCPANQPSATLIGGTAAIASRVPPSLPASGLLIVGQSIRV